MKRFFSIFGILVALSLFNFSPAEANENVAKRVQGEWLVTFDNLRTWVLRVKGHKEDGPGQVWFYGYFGENGETFPTPTDVLFTTGAGLSLSFSTRRARIEAKEERAGLFVGSITRTHNSVPVRFERLAAEEIKKRPFNIPAIRKEARLEMIYLAADNCPYCAMWESGKKQRLLASPEGKAVRFVEVRQGSFGFPFQKGNYPPEYRWVYDQIGASRGVPRFLLAIDGKVMLSTLGSGAGYDDAFLPALKEVVAARRQASSE